MSELLLTVAGIYHLLFLIFHLMFWRLFNWKDDLKTLSFINKSIFQVLNICLSLVFGLFAYISIVHADELLTTTLGHTLLRFITFFWIARGIQQILFFKLRHWSSWVFTIIFILGAVLYGIPYFKVAL